MKITIENTDKIVELTGDKGSVPARIWEGETDSGIKVICMVTRIMVKRDQDCSQFERELKETRPASAEVQRVIPLRLIL